MRLDGFFTIQNNQREASRQEYALAKQHFSEVLHHRVTGVPEHESRFRDAADRQTAARQALVRVLCE